MRWQCRPQWQVSRARWQRAVKDRRVYVGAAVRDEIPFDIPCTENNTGSFMLRIIKQNQNYRGVFDSHYSLKVTCCVLSVLCHWLVTPSRDQTPHHRHVEQKCQCHSACLMSWLLPGSGMPMPRLGVVSEKLPVNTLCY